METEKEFLCDCGHYEKESDIHSVANAVNAELVDLCENCWQKADIITDDKEVLSAYKFASKESEKLFVKRMHELIKISATNGNKITL